MEICKGGKKNLRYEHIFGSEQPKLSTKLKTLFSVFEQTVNDFKMSGSPRHYSVL